MKILNLEKFLKERNLNYKVIVGPRFESGVNGKLSEDRFYILNSSIEQKKYVRSVWRSGELSPNVEKAILEFDINETKMIHSNNLDNAKRVIILEGSPTVNKKLSKN